MLGRAALAIWGAQRATAAAARRGPLAAWRAPSRTMFIQTKGTPNAHAVMFLPGREVLPEGAPVTDFANMRTAATSPLARQLFGVDGVAGVFFGSDFITITKGDQADWAVVRPEVFEVLMDFFTDGSQPVLAADASYESDTAIGADDDEVVAMIKELLENRVKPAVAADGGSVLYRGFDPEKGILRLELQGACSTCSSSAITLKTGIESMMRHYIPEVNEVVQVLGEHADAAQKASEKALSDMEKRLEEQGIIRP